VMWKEVLDIGPQCVERFLGVNRAPEIAALGIELAGCSNLSGNYCVARTRPSTHTLFFTLSGRGRLRTKQAEYSLEPQSLAILPAKQAFEVRIDDNHWDIIWLNLSATSKWQQFALSQAEVLHCPQLEPLHNLLEYLYKELLAERRNTVLPIVDSYLFNTLNKELQANENIRVKQLFQNIEHQLQQQWTIEMMCDDIHYSAPHLHRLCLQTFQRSPIQQLIYMRLERAKKLLVSTDWPIAHIANYVGYNNIFNFSNRFRRSIGVSPSQYRKQNR